MIKRPDKVLRGTGATVLGDFSSVSSDHPRQAPDTVYLLIVTSVPGTVTGAQAMWTKLLLSLSLKSRGKERH